nr:MAG TPA: tail assembly chaperone protein [Caudoviricetes sp.]
MSEVLDVLLGGTARNVNRELPTKEYNVLRLSKETGQLVIFKLQALTYNRAAELAGMSYDMDAQTVLSGVAAPNLRDVRLAVKLGLLQEGEEWGAHGVTPVELVKALLLPGEIAAISRMVQQLSGYQTVTLKEVKKN